MGVGVGGGVGAGVGGVVGAGVGVSHQLPPQPAQFCALPPHQPPELHWPFPVSQPPADEAAAVPRRPPFRRAASGEKVSVISDTKHAENRIAAGDA